MFGDGDDDKYFGAQKIKANISCSLELDSGSGVRSYICDPPMSVSSYLWYSLSFRVTNIKIAILTRTCWASTQQSSLFVKSAILVIFGQDGWKRKLE